MPPVHVRMSVQPTFSLSQPACTSPSRGFKRYPISNSETSYNLKPTNTPPLSRPVTQQKLLLASLQLCQWLPSALGLSLGQP